MNKINNFNSKHLVVDYISFKFQNLQFNQEKIANYLFSLGFNIYQKSGRSSQPIREAILVDLENEAEAWFFHDNLYWRGSLIQFSGLNAAKFYRYVKINLIDWKIFENAVLSRFDLDFERQLKITDQISIKDFLTNCQHELKKTQKNIRLEKNQKGWILSVVNRRTNNYS